MKKPAIQYAFLSFEVGMGWGGWGNKVHVNLNRNGSVICVSWGGDVVGWGGWGNNVHVNLNMLRYGYLLLHLQTRVMLRYGYLLLRLHTHTHVMLRYGYLL